MPICNGGEVMVRPAGLPDGWERHDRFGFDQETPNLGARFSGHEVGCRMRSYPAANGSGPFGRRPAAEVLRPTSSISFTTNTVREDRRAMDTRSKDSTGVLVCPAAPVLRCTARGLRLAWRRQSADRPAPLADRTPTTTTGTLQMAVYAPRRNARCKTRRYVRPDCRSTPRGRGTSRLAASTDGD